MDQIQIYSFEIQGSTAGRLQSVLFPIWTCLCRSEGTANFALTFKIFFTEILHLQNVVNSRKYGGMFEVQSPGNNDKFEERICLNKEHMHFPNETGTTYLEE